MFSKSFSRTFVPKLLIGGCAIAGLHYGAYHWFKSQPNVRRNHRPTAQQEQTNRRTSPLTTSTSSKIESNFAGRHQPHTSPAPQTSTFVPDWIPLIDVGPLLNGTLVQQKQVAKRLFSAFRESGFAYIKNHGVREDLMESVLLQAQDTFVDPRPQKSSHVKRSGNDPKEYIMIEKDVIDRDFSDTCLPEYYDALKNLKNKLLRGIAMGMGADQDFFEKHHSKDYNTLGVIHYFPVTKDTLSSTQNRCKAHSDWGSITLLLQDDTGGLEVWNEKHQKWVKVIPIKGTLVVNTASMLQSWTGNALKSTLHRVVSPQSLQSADMDQSNIDAQSRQHRYSVPFFVDPNKDIKLKDIDESLSSEEIPGDYANYIKWRIEESAKGNKTVVTFPLPNPEQTRNDANVDGESKLSGG